MRELTHDEAARVTGGRLIVPIGLFVPHKPGIRYWLRLICLWLVPVTFASQCATATFDGDVPDARHLAHMLGAAITSGLICSVGVWLIVRGRARRRTGEGDV